jgi:hypothetical protein
MNGLILRQTPLSFDLPVREVDPVSREDALHHHRPVEGQRQVVAIGERADQPGLDAADVPPRVVDLPRSDPLQSAALGRPLQVVDPAPRLPAPKAQVEQ